MIMHSKGLETIFFLLSQNWSLSKSSKRLHVAIFGVVKCFGNKLQNSSR